MATDIHIYIRGTKWRLEVLGEQRIEMASWELSGKSLPGGAVTISTYDDLIAFMAGAIAADIEAKNTERSQERFRRAAEKTRRNKPDHEPTTIDPN